jgi:glucosamine 6-phosphate synthetase-like amidotransferase/phosphosugar isomerase protein
MRGRDGRRRPGAPRAQRVARRRSGRARAKRGLAGSTGIAHTRWATHGAPATCNAHPIFSRDEIALVHNGIIENHETLRRQLSDAHYEFDGQTDTEVVAHLIHSCIAATCSPRCAMRRRSCTARMRSPCSASTSRSG